MFNYERNIVEMFVVIVKLQKRICGVPKLEKCFIIAIINIDKILLQLK